MSSTSRDSSRDRELVLKHQSSASFSESSRGNIPMWDSSDPERAPPPLPLNPGVGSQPITRPNASATVTAAAEAIAARARESSYPTSPTKSPEKSLIKGHHHRRMQSLQTSGMKDFSSYLENKSPEKALRLPIEIELHKSPERNTPTPTPSSKDREGSRPSSRPGLKAILGDSTPQSATMRALNGTPTSENEPLSNITNNSSALVKGSQNMDAISNQIMGLTSICTRLQQEMAALSRRSKDNATDLVSLKDATYSRDEDIRQSLKNLVTNLATKGSDSDDGELRPRFARSTGSQPAMSKSFSLPRIPSPTSFAASLDQELATTPNPFSVDGAPAIAMLEKIIREMATREGVEKLMSSVNETSPKVGQDSRISKHLEEVIGLLKEQSTSKALVRAGPQSQVQSTMLNFSNQDRPFASPKAADFVTDDILKLLRKMKDSIAEGGGMSGEIKALVRELRGEVLGMGREIGRKLDQAESNSQGQTGDQGIATEEISQIVEEGLEDLKTHMDRVLQEHRRQSASSLVSRSAVDSQEVYAVVKSALKELPVPEPQQGSGIEREEILEAVREAWETYKPEIELQNFGLERDEILQCLKEGLEDYKPNGQKDEKDAIYDEVLDAVRDGLKDFTPPKPDTEASLTKEEILITVKECLDSYDFPPNHNPRESDITRDDVLDAVKEGLSNQAPLAKEIEFNRDDLFDAVKAGLEGCRTPMTGVGEQVLEKMQDLIDGMRGEFQQYSAANGRDTEQVLDAMKDGLEVLRSSIEGYVDRASDVTGKDEIVETVRNGLDGLRVDLEASIANSRPATTGDSAELLDAMEREFEHLRSTLSTTIARSEAPTAGREEILDAIREGFEDAPNDSNSSEVKEELQHLREALASTITRGGDSFDREEILEAIKDGIDRAQLGLSKNKDRPESILSNTSELIDHFNDGLENLKADVERIVNKPIDMTVNYEILDTLKEGLNSVRADLEALKTHQAVSAERGAESPELKRGGEVIIADEEMTRGLQKPDIANLEVMIAQLKIKVESLDDKAPQAPPAPATSVPEDTAAKTDIERLESMVKEVQDGVNALMDREQVQQENAVTKEDIDAIETLLRNTKDKIEEIPLPDMDIIAKAEHFEILETILKNTKDAVEDLSARQEAESATKEEIAGLELIIKEIQTSMQEVKNNITDEPASKEDLNALATICTEYQESMKEIMPEAVPSKEDFESLRGLVQEFREKFDADAEMTAQAFDARKTEHGGIADKIEDVKAFVEAVRKELKDTLDGSGSNIQEITTSLTVIGEAVTAASAAATVSELKEILEREFEKTHANHETSKTDFEQHRDTIVEKHDEHRQAVIEDLTTKLDARFDELMTKYDDAQAAADSKASTFEDQSKEQAESVASAKAVTDDLKILIDTLGSTVTETCERISEDSQTVFTKVEEINNKMDETVDFLRVDGKADHQLTRAEVSKALVAVEALQADASQFNPKLMDVINEVLRQVSQHYEESQKSTEEIKTSVKDIPNTIPVPALPAPLEETDRAPPAAQYDDSQVHTKLDKLVESAAHFEMLEQIKDQVSATHKDFENFMNAQQATIMNMQETRAREAEEAGIALEKRSAQKETVEADIVRLSEERSKLECSVADLTQEKTDLAREREELAGLKAKLQTDVSTLEMALEMRREEMHYMEGRAEALERRVIEGVMDHSRSLLISSRPSSSLKSMNLKRVSSNASSNATVTTKGDRKSVPSSAVSSAIGMAMKKRQTPNGSPAASQTGRRILSLSTLGANKGIEKPMMNSSSIVSKSASALGAGLKRSHSVKSNFPSRKTSWGGTKQIGMFGDEAPEEDKENSLLEEEDEEDFEDGDRRSSYTGTYTGTEMSYETGSVADTADDRRTSYARSAAGTVDGEEGEGGELQLYKGQEQPAAVGESNDVILYGAVDSALGTEPPTAALEAGPEYFVQR